MSLNAEQSDHLDYLSSLNPADRCYCGWNPVNDCWDCPKGASLAQRLKVQCPDPRCRNYPYLGGKPTITHNIKCSMPDWQPGATVTNSE